MSKHTPGPWNLGRRPFNVVGMVNGREEVVAVVNDMPCIGGHDDLAAERGADMEAANARLIAAAPELLEACLLARHICEAGNALQQQLDAAIAKAAGEQE